MSISRLYGEIVEYMHSDWWWVYPNLTMGFGGFCKFCEGSVDVSKSMYKSSALMKKLSKMEHDDDCLYKRIFLDKES